VVIDQRKQGLDKKAFAAIAAEQSNLEKTILFRIWAMYERPGEEEEAGGGKAKADRGGEEDEEEDEDEDDKLALIRQEVIETIVKNCSKRPLFERARVLAGNITYKSYIELYKISRNVAKHLDE
jgi:hypothetical protein